MRTSQSGGPRPLAAAPRVGDIARNTEIGHQHAAIVGGLVVASLAASRITRQRWGLPATVLVLFALHPA